MNGKVEIGSIRNGVYALRRYQSWAIAHFGTDRGLVAEPAIVGLFLVGNFVTGGSDGHASTVVGGWFGSCIKTLEFSHCGST